MVAGLSIKWRCMVFCILLPQSERLCHKYFWDLLSNVSLKCVVPKLLNCIFTITAGTFYSRFQIMFKSKIAYFNPLLSVIQDCKKTPYRVHSLIVLEQTPAIFNPMT